MVAQSPGKGTRKSYLRETAAKRLAQGLGRIGEEERLSTFHQGGPSSSGESQETEEPQDKKAKSEVDYNEAGPQGYHCVLQLLQQRGRDRSEDRAWDFEHR